MNVAEIGVAKVSKYASRESGDSVDIVERPDGGISVIIVDGQGSGRSAKTISHLVTIQTGTLLKQGAHDDVAARAAHDQLFAYRHGQVSATLNILTVDINAKKIFITRNTNCPVFVWEAAKMTVYDTEVKPIGIYAHTQPDLVELPLPLHGYILAMTDGVVEAGRRYNQEGDLSEDFRLSLSELPEINAQTIADRLLALALTRDKNRPEDDMSIVVIALKKLAEEPLLVRRMSMVVPYA